MRHPRSGQCQNPTSNSSRNVDRAGSAGPIFWLETERRWLGTYVAEERQERLPEPRACKMTTKGMRAGFLGRQPKSQSSQFQLYGGSAQEHCKRHHLHLTNDRWIGRLQELCERSWQRRCPVCNLRRLFHGDQELAESG